MSIQVSEFRHIPGKNDAEYIKLLKESLERQKQITSKAIAKIKELSNSSEIPNSWIPFTPETMPKKDGEYLVTFEEGYADDYNLSLVSIASFEVDCEGFGFWKERFDLASMGSLGSDWEEIPVLAWQPLPEPYRIEGEEE